MKITGRMDSDRFYRPANGKCVFTRGGGGGGKVVRGSFAGTFSD